MNNNLLFFGLAGAGLWYLTRTKTTSPPVLAENSVNGYSQRPAVGNWVQGSNGRWYPAAVATTTPMTNGSTTFNPGAIIKDAGIVASTIKDTWGTIKDVFDGKSTASVTTSTPSSVKSSAGSSVPTLSGF
jgi:hypothetical protein